MRKLFVVIAIVIVTASTVHAQKKYNKTIVNNGTINQYNHTIIQDNRTQHERWVDRMNAQNERVLRRAMKAAERTQRIHDDYVRKTFKTRKYTSGKRRY